MPRQLSKLFAGFCLFLAMTAVRASGDEVDRAVQDVMRWKKTPGVALAVIRDGKVIRTQGYGFANLELQVPVRPETIFQSGSLGKQFTATAAMILVEEGEISLDDKITKYFPDAPATWNGITIRRLLTHTSGIKNYTDNDLNYRADYTEEDLLKKAESLPLDFAPGDKWNYSNTGYLLLGILIHRVTGQFYGDFLQDRIFKPLGMTTTRIISESDIVPNRAAGYRLVKHEIKNQEYVSASLNTTADGSLYITVLDFAKWDAALYTEKLLKKASLQQMWTPVKLNNGTAYPYGFGWFLNDIRGHRIIEHTGSWQGFTGAIARYVNDRLTVVALTNCASGGVSEIVHQVAGTYIPALKPLPPPKAIADTAPESTTILRKLLGDLAEGKASQDSFAPEFAKKWFPDESQEFQKYLADAGPIDSIELLSRKDVKGSEVSRYRIKLPEHELLMDLTLTPEKKIAGFESPE